MRTMVTAVAAALTLLALAAPVASSSAGPVQVREVIFHSPSQNVRCDGWWFGTVRSGNAVQCAVMSTVGDSPGGYLNNRPNVYRLGATGRASVERAVWQIGLGRVVRYGASVRIGYISCSSRSQGVTCRSRLSGHGFFLSRQGQRTF